MCYSSNDSGASSLLLLIAFVLLSSLTALLFRALLNQYQLARKFRTTIAQNTEEQRLFFSAPASTLDQGSLQEGLRFFERHTESEQAQTLLLRLNDSSSQAVLQPDWSVLQRLPRLRCSQSTLDIPLNAHSSARTCVFSQLRLAHSVFLAGNLETDVLTFDSNSEIALFVAVSGSIKIGSRIDDLGRGAGHVILIAGGSIELGGPLPSHGKLSLASLNEHISLEELQSQHLRCPTKEESSSLALELMARKGFSISGIRLHEESPIGCRFRKEHALWPKAKVIGISLP